MYKKPLIIAHSGSVEGIGAESLNSYQAAIEAGVDMVEADIWRTQDGVFVCQHEHRINGTTINELKSSTLPSSTLKLEDLLKLIVKKNSTIMIDLKEFGYEKEIVQYVLQFLQPTMFVISTLNDETIKVISTNFPEVQVGLSLGKDKPKKLVSTRLSEVFPYSRIKRSGAKFLSVNSKIAALFTLKQHKLLGLPIYVWTVDDETTMRRLLNNPKVTGLITNRPLVALKICKEYETRHTN
jgi:glycerophosphoryl diester phosphodiesterase